MVCGIQCVKPTRSQAHCGVCHVTFGGVRAFDVHRRGGECALPASLGMAQRATGRLGVYSWPITPEQRQRLVDRLVLRL